MLRRLNRIKTVSRACTKHVAGEARNTVAEKPLIAAISGGSDATRGRLVAAQVDANGIQWVVREPRRPS